MQSQINPQYSKTDEKFRRSEAQLAMYRSRSSELVNIAEKILVRGAADCINVEVIIQRLIKESRRKNVSAIKLLESNKQYQI
jgi:hypothetical protein